MATFSAGELYGVAEARGWDARLFFRLRGARLSLRTSGLGGALYHERVSALSVKWLSDADTEMEVEVRALELGAEGVPSLWSLTCDVGMTRRVLGSLALGVRCENVTSTEIGASPVASTLSLGAAVLLPTLSLETGTLVQAGFDPSPRIGFEAEITEWWRLRAGACGSPGVLAIGFGAGRAAGARPAASSDGRARRAVGAWPCVDVAWQWHPRLGVSSFVSVSKAF